MKRIFIALAAGILMMVSPVIALAQTGYDPGTYNTAQNGYEYTAPTVDDPSLSLYDFADLLTDEEEAELQEVLHAVEAEKNMSVIAVTSYNVANGTSSLKTSADYAMDFYDANADSWEDDAFVLLIDMNNRVLYCVGHGKYAAYRYDSFCEDDLMDDIEDSAKAGDYAEVIRIYAQDVKDLKDGGSVRRYLPSGFELFIGAVAGLFVMLAGFAIHRSSSAKNNTAIPMGSFAIQENDKKVDFLGKTVTRRVIRDDDSGGGGSSHHSGGGGSFSGGGRSF